MGGNPIYIAKVFVKTGFAGTKYAWKTHLTDDGTQAGLSRSICEEALNQFAESDDSLAGVILEHDISVRDFMLLSLVCDQDCFDIDQLQRALGLGNEDVRDSISRLGAAGMVRPDSELPPEKRDQRVCATGGGHEFARRILRSMDLD